MIGLGSKEENVRSSEFHTSLAMSCSSRVTQASIPSPNRMSTKIVRFRKTGTLEPMLLIHIGFPHAPKISFIES